MNLRAKRNNYNFLCTDNNCYQLLLTCLYPFIPFCFTKPRPVEPETKMCTSYHRAYNKVNNDNPAETYEVFKYYFSMSPLNLHT